MRHTIILTRLNYLKGHLTLIRKNCLEKNASITPFEKESPRKKLERGKRYLKENQPPKMYIPNTF